MSKHTPGPWKATYSNYWLVESSRVQVADLFAISKDGPDDDGDDVFASEEEQTCNAQLIAAAPELLAACEAVIEEQSIGMYGAISNECIAQLRAAIARATGD